ncbi:MAG: hypothetical protein ABIE42_11325 [Candidatus Eisenbacteria bacterium]
MLRTAINLLALTSMLTVAGAKEIPDLFPEVPVRGRPPVEVGAIQVSIEGRFVSVEQTDLSEFTFATRRLDDMPPSFEQYLIDGGGQMSFVSSTPQLGAPDEGWSDMYWCGTYLWGSWCQWMRAFNTDGTQVGHFDGPESPNRAIARDGVWWYAARPDGYLWRGQWDAQWGSTPVWSSITDHTIPNLTGLAFDTNADALWAVMSNSLVRQYAKDGGPMLAELPLLPAYGSPRACCMSNTVAFGYTLAVLHTSERSGDWLILYDMSDTPVETVTWASIKAMFR